MNPSIDNKAFYKKMWKLALPIALQNLMLAAVAACDALMLGRVAQAEMTAVSLAAQIQFVQNMFLMAATSAGSILGAQYFGKGDLRTVRELFSLILRVCGLIALVTFAACEFAPGLLMRMFTHDAELIELGSVYLRIAGWSYLMSGISQSFLTVMKFTDHPPSRRPTACSSPPPWGTGPPGSSAGGQARISRRRFDAWRPWGRGSRSGGMRSP